LLSAPETLPATPTAAAAGWNLAAMLGPDPAPSSVTTVTPAAGWNLAAMLGPTPPTKAPAKNTTAAASAKDAEPQYIVRYREVRTCTPYGYCIVQQVPYFEVVR
jgi:hypothetical protein